MKFEIEMMLPGENWRLLPRHFHSIKLAAAAIPLLFENYPEIEVIRIKRLPNDPA